MEECIFSPGEYIFKESDKDDCSLFYLIKGRVQLVFESNNVRREDIVLSVLDKRSYFGEISFITGNPRTFTAKA